MNGSKPVSRRDALLAEINQGPVVRGMGVGRLLTAREVAMLFQVTTRTVNEWAKRGRIPTVHTPGGQRRFPASSIVKLLSEEYESNA